MAFPKEAAAAGCSYGLASMGQDIGSGGIASVSDVTWPVLAHEIGHNFVLAHAKSRRCSSATDVGLARVPSGCAVDEYGDASTTLPSGSTFTTYGSGRHRLGPLGGSHDGQHQGQHRIRNPPHRRTSRRRDPQGRAGRRPPGATPKVTISTKGVVSPKTVKGA